MRLFLGLPTFRTFYLKLARLGMLSRLQRDLICHAANTLYLSFIHPIFDYGDTVWNCCGVGNARLLDNFQRRASKIVSRSMDSDKA